MFLKHPFLGDDADLREHTATTQPITTASDDARVATVSEAPIIYTMTSTDSAEDDSDVAATQSPLDITPAAGAESDTTESTSTTPAASKVPVGLWLALFSLFT